MIGVDVVARVLLLPVIALQALFVHRNALILPEPDGARRGVTGHGPPLRLLIVGDSSAAGVGATTQQEALSGQLAGNLAQEFTLHWRLEAGTGATTATMLTRLTLSEPETFDIAVLVLGVNDVTRMVTRRRWIAGQRALHQLLQDRFGVRGIYASGLPPMGLFPLLPQPLRWILGAQAARLDRALAAIASQSPVVCHLPFDLPHEARFFARDGYHPAPAAYALWAQALAGMIRRDCRKAG